MFFFPLYLSLFFSSTPVWIAEKDKIKATAAIPFPLALQQIGPLSKAGLIYQHTDGYWNWSAAHKSGQWISSYLEQGRHHSGAVREQEDGHKAFFPPVIDATFSWPLWRPKHDTLLSYKEL